MSVRFFVVRLKTLLLASSLLLLVLASLLLGDRLLFDYPSGDIRETVPDAFTGHRKRREMR